MTRLVYFMKPKGKKGPIKIGCSNCPSNRLEALSAWSPWPLEVVGTIPGGFTEEQFLHRAFHPDHIHREWFKYSVKLAEVISRVLSAQSLDCVRAELTPAGDIHRKSIRPKRNESERLRFSYSTKIRICQERMRKSHDAFYAPDDVHRIMRDWEHSGKMNQRPIPDRTLLARIDEYLSDPVTHSVIPAWARHTRRAEPICIPHVAEAPVHLGSAA